MLKITDFFSQEELLACEPFDMFHELSVEYWDLFTRHHKNDDMSEPEKIKAIRVIVRMISSIFGLPLLIACDCYVKMLDTADFYEADKKGYEEDMTKVLEEHLAEEENSETNPKQAELENMKNLLERAWKKEINE